MTSTFFVSAVPSIDGNFADCTYYSDYGGTDPIPMASFSIPKNAGSATFQQIEQSNLVLIGATFSTLGGTPSMNSSNFSPADPTGGVTVTMPTAYVATKGVVLLFSSKDVVDNLYPSSDPQVTNDGGVHSVAPATV